MKQNKLFYALLLALFLPLAAKNNCNTDCKVNCKPCSVQSIDCIDPIVDYIIVGNGTAGATLARFLSDPIDNEFTNDVLVLEAGSNYSTDMAVTQTQLFPALRLGLDNKYGKNYATFASVTNPTLPGYNFGITEFLYVYGRLWGGSSAINAMAAVRGTPRLYDDWATESGSTQWNYTNLLPIFTFLENYTSNTEPSQCPADRGTTGDLYITQDNYARARDNPFNMHLATASGSPIVPDFNCPTADVAISADQRWVNPNTGERSFSANAFLTSDVVTPEGRGVNGRKLRILSQATVARVMFDTSGSTPIAVGVEYILDGNREQVIQVYARKKVILCAGALADVAILQRSGVRPNTTELNDLNLPMIVESSQVGQNLQNHFGAAALSQALSTTDLAPIGPEIQQAFIDCAGFNGCPDDDRRRIQILYEGDAFLFPYLPLVGFNPVNPYNSYGVSIMDPLSRGTVTVPDTDPLTSPVVRWNFFAGELTPVDCNDLAKVVAALKTIKAAVNADGGSMVWPPEFAFSDDGLLVTLMNGAPFIQYHAVGSCKMGTSIANGVVDGDLHVFGVNNLMVADCSVEPFIQDGNTAYAAYVIGAVAARICGSQTVPALP